MFTDREIDLICERSAVITTRIIADIVGLNESDIKMLRLLYKENLSIDQVADEMAMSISSLYRKRKKVRDKFRMGLDLWGVKANDRYELTVDNVFTRDNLFCQAQAELVRYFFRNRGDADSQKLMVETIRKMCGNVEDYYSIGSSIS